MYTERHATWLIVIVTLVLLGGIDMMPRAAGVRHVLLMRHVTIALAARAWINWTTIALLSLLLLEIEVVSLIINLLINETLGLKRPVRLTRRLFLWLLSWVITAGTHIEIVSL